MFGYPLFSQTPYSAKIIGLASNFGPWGDGTIFSLNHDGSNFQVARPLGAGRGLDGSYPVGTIIEGPNGKLYGLTYGGGVHNTGTIYSINQDGSGFTVLRHLLDTVDGGNPHRGLYLGIDNALYGVASIGGQNSAGTVFKIQTDGTGFQVLHDFNALTGDMFRFYVDCRRCGIQYWHLRHVFNGLPA